MFGYTKLGQIKAIPSKDIETSRIGIGLEKLDRNLYDPAPCYGPIGELGVKWVRIQSGWCRTEKEKGVFDYAWLDSIVDNLLAQGTQPWICLCYGNELYTPEACNRAGSVGRPPIHTEAERAAWDNYVSKTVQRYKDRVQLWEIWNEPDGCWCWRPQVNAKEYGEFALRTAKVIKAADPHAKVLTGSFCIDPAFLQTYMSRELAQLSDYVTYHRYAFDMDTGLTEYVKTIRAILDSFGGEHIGIIQGETGTQSDWSTQGALRNAEWTERKQAKFLLRKMLADLISEVVFTSYFSTVDIFENIADDSGERTRPWYGFFGVLGEEFDENGIPLGRYFRKQAFRSMQVLSALFAGAEKEWLPMQFCALQDERSRLMDFDAAKANAAVLSHGFRLRNGQKAFAYWKIADIMTEEFDGKTSMHFYGATERPVLVDMLAGDVYALPEDSVEEKEGELLVKHLPIRDYPMLLVFGKPDAFIEEA